MKITVHRGTHQIGGCVTEIASGNDRVFIDFGTDLPGCDGNHPAKPIPGLTVPDGSNCALFLTHYHGDHVGRLEEVAPGVPVYFGATAREIYLRYLKRIGKEIIDHAEAMLPIAPLRTMRHGRISVTPLMVDHSAFDAYMFLIEADGKKILHTGDFRLHGFRGNKTLPILQKYAGDVDLIICETTNLSRDEIGMTERNLQNEAHKIMQENKYVFVLCSSTNIDRIGAFYHANPHGRLFVCDEYQKEILGIVRKNHALKSRFYNFSHVYSYGANLDALLDEQGFCMLIRQGSQFARLLDQYRGRDAVVYSMWSGYLKGETRNEDLAAFLAKEQLVFLHTSGHACASDLVALCRTIRPKCGVIPIHGETPEQLSALLPEIDIHILNDGEIFFL